jgi:nucleoside-diphosphate-sugar epimerase
MRVFVTGATGFIGAHLCQRLVSEGHEVVALVRDPKKAAAELPKHGVETLAGDLTLFQQEGLVPPACDVVIHLAGVVTAKSPALYDEINFVAVQNLVKALSRQSFRPRRLLFASSLAAAGPCLDRKPKSESDPAEPVEPYGRAKLKAEHFLAAEAPFPTTSFRPSIVFGPRDTATLSFFKMAMRGVGFRIAGEPQGLSFIDVDDAVSGIVAMMDDESDAHRVYFLSANEQMDTELLWQAMAEATERRLRVIRVPRTVLCGAMWTTTGLSRVFGFHNQLDRKQYDQMVAPAFMCSSQALQSAHGWVPEVSLVSSLRKAWNAYRQDGWL